MFGQVFQLWYMPLLLVGICCYLVVVSDFGTPVTGVLSLAVLLSHVAYTLLVLDSWYRAVTLVGYSYRYFGHDGCMSNHLESESYICLL